MNERNQRVAPWLRLLAASPILLLLGLFAGAANAEMEWIELENGEKFEAEVIERRDDVVVIEHPIFGRVEIPTADIKKEEEKAVEPGLFGSSILQGWTRKLGLGVSGSQGNSEAANVNAALDIERDTDGYTGSFRSRYFFSSNQGTKSTNEFFARYLHDLKFGDSPWFLSGALRYDYDEFQSWEHRIAAQVAPGYWIVKNDTFQLRTNVGVGVARTFGIENDWKPEGVVSGAFVWNITDMQKLEGDTSYFPNLKDLPEFRMLSNLAYAVKIGPFEALSLKVGLQNEYNSESVGDNNKLNYYGNLVYDF